ncbi:DNA helicase MCM9 isoform X3 [Amphiprion ocellaris]|uniref:DNA helicase MCM9 isoform X3 n=1 Tax=Amphiprion ocellaris TaxID=80972 RepID=UPI002410FCF9|nr:DNA helicase MCM9 isoform X3 [Amphiprion ocellaris]
MMIGPEQEALIGRVFESYLTEHHHGDLLQLSGGPPEEIHRPVVVNAMTLFETSMEVGDYFNAFPEDVLAVFDKVLHRKAVETSQGSPLRPDGRNPTFHARITGLPVCPELTRDTVPRSRDVGHFLSVTGTVIRTSVAKVLEFERDYICTKCRHVFTVQADFDQFYTFVPPRSCSNQAGCNSFKFSCLSEGCEPSSCRDYQEIKIQEQVQRLTVGSIPRSVVVVLEDDLVDSCKSGDEVTVYGVVCQRWRPLFEGSRCEVELVLKANNMEVNNQQTAAALLIKDVQNEFEEFWQSFRTDPITGRNHILLSLCPQVFGMYVVKLAVALVLAGGVQRVDSSGTKIRGECHMLLVGDPGTGKSQFLKYAAKITPRSILTAGIGSTSAGLTVAVVKDGGEWHLEAGALVLSDGGLCCIDEFNSIKEHDRISIHEAMEQQSISVAKAGMVCKLNTRATILAATNPKGRYDPREPLSVNVALASPLLSRFDLVLVLLDSRNPDWDRIISSFILEDRAHSRLMFRETVTIEDAVIAVSVMECSMQGGALLGTVNTLLTSFPADPDLQYRTQCQVLLEGLKLPLLLQKEMDRLDGLKTSSSEGSQLDPQTGDQQSPGLGWTLHSVSPEDSSFLPAQLSAGHIIMSTQENHQNVLRNIDFKQDEGSGKTVVSENPQRWKEERHREPELQKVSEDLRFQQQQNCRRHAEGAESMDRTGSMERAAPVEGSEPAKTGKTAASDKLRSSKVFYQNKPSSGPEGQREDGSDPMKNLRAALKNQTAAEGPSDLQKKLSGFRFRPTKMNPVSPDGSATKNHLVQHIPQVREQRASRTGSTATKMDQRRTTAEALSPQRSRTNTGYQTRIFTALEPNSDDPLRSSRTMASSARAKLSRFSFTCAGDAGHLSSKTKRTLSSPDSPAGKRSRSQQVLPLSAAGWNHEEPAPETDSRPEQTEVQQQHRPRLSDAQVPCVQNRRCFRLDPPTGSKCSAALFSGLSLFGSAEFSNDVLDTNWDQEVLKKS